MSSLVRDMTKDDIDRVGEILYDSFTTGAVKHGYAPVMQSVQEGKGWAWAMFHHGSSENLVGVVDDCVVGAVFLSRRGAVAGAGPMAIDPAFQGKTITAKLMKAIHELAEGVCMRVVQEAFNSKSFSMLYAYDYTPVAELMDIYLHGNTSLKTDFHPDIAELSAHDLDAFHAYDFPRSRFDRRADFKYYVRWGKVLVYRDQSQIRGYLACLPGSGSVQLGPLLAEGEEEAECLFRHALAIFRGKTCRTRVMARDSRLVHALLKLGFRLYCTNFLMVRGAWRPGPYIESFGRFPEGV